MASVKGNVVLNVINTVVGLLFPIITFPYVSRIIQPEGIGIIHFYQSIINYIILLSALGIPLYAVREISKYKNDIDTRNKVTLEILLLHGILSAVGYIIVFILILTVDKIHSDWPLFLLLSFSIFLNVIGVPWFYQAIEDFKFITFRSLIVRFASLIAIFVFVRSKSDLYIYAIILVGGQVGNYLFNFLRLKKYSIITNLSRHKYNLKPHLYASLKIFILNLSISLYVNINPVMLGFMSNDVYVGYYTSVTKIISVISGFTNAMGMAILPRLSNYYAAAKIKEYNALKYKAINITCTICIPISIGLILVASNLIPVFSGQKFLPAINTLRISAPTLLISAINYIIAIQVLYTQNKEKIVIIATMLGGIINIGLNLFLIPYLKQNGTAVSGLLAELTVFITCYILGRKYIKYNFWNTNNQQVVIASLVSALICWLINLLDFSCFIALPLQIIFSIVIYSYILLVCKNEFFLEYLILIKSRINNILIKNR